MSIHKFIIVFVYLMYIIESSIEYVQLPIKLYNTHPLETSEEYPIFTDFVYYSTEIEFGSPPVKYDVIVDFISLSYYLVTHKISEDKKYKPISENSSTLRCSSDIIDIQGEIRTGRDCEDNIKIGNESLTKFPIVLADNLDYNIKVKMSSGVIGLTHDTPLCSDFDFEYPNLITNLKHSMKIPVYDFTVKFDDDLRKGIINIGIDLSELGKTYNETKFKYVKVHQKFTKTKGWSFLRDGVYYGNQLIKERKYENRIEISINEWMITGTSQFNETIYDQFFKEKINNKICKFVNYTRNHYSRYIYSCNKDLDISNFHDINFYIKDLENNLTLTKDDLFFDYKDKKIFSVMFSDYDDSAWIFGSMFIKKFYPVIFNQNSKTIGFYFNDKPLEQKKRNNFLSVFIIILLNLVALIGIGYLIFKIYQFKKRKRLLRKSEIEDEYNYQSVNELDQQ